MKYDFVPACIYDIISYSIASFCGKEYIQSTLRIVKNAANILDSCDEFYSKYRVVPPAKLYPFFFFTGVRPCAFTSFCYDNIGFLEPYEKIKLYISMNEFESGNGEISSE